MPFLDVLNAVARVVGGTQPSNSQTSIPAPVPTADDPNPFDPRPYWYSGMDTGDGSGISGVVGCFSLPVSVINSTPVAMVMPTAWRHTDQIQHQGRKFLEDEVRVRVLTGHDDIMAAMAFLVNFRDLVEAAFDSHMQLFGTMNVLTSDARSGEFLVLDLGGTSYVLHEVAVFIQRAVPVTYVA